MRLKVAGWFFLLVGCNHKTDPRVLRLGFFPTVTHAVALTGIESGRLAASLGSVRLETRGFNAGPAAIEALFAGAIDAAYVGPMPAVNGHLRSHGRLLRVVAGAASGATRFVVREGANIRVAADLHGKRLASPQLGNTQDLALRRYLRDHGLSTTDRGGDVSITPMENANILNTFRRGQIDGAWVPEPWGARLVAEAGGRVFLDERDLWPDRSFAITLLVVRARYLRDAPAAVERLVDAHGAEVRWIRANPTDARELTNRALAGITGHGLPDALMATAWSQLDVTADPLLSSVRTTATAAQSLGFVPRGSIDDLLDARLVARAIAASEATR